MDKDIARLKSFLNNHGYHNFNITIGFKARDDIGEVFRFRLRVCNFDNDSIECSTFWDPIQDGCLHSAVNEILEEISNFLGESE